MNDKELSIINDNDIRDLGFYSSLCKECEKEALDKAFVVRRIEYNINKPPSIIKNYLCEECFEKNKSKYQEF